MVTFENRKPKKDENGMEIPGLTTIGVLNQVCSNPGTNGSLNIEQLRERIKIMDALDEAKEKNADNVELDDKLHGKLCEMLNGFQFAVAHRDLLNIVEDVLSAKPAKAH